MGEGVRCSFKAGKNGEKRGGPRALRRDDAGGAGVPRGKILASKFLAAEGKVAGSSPAKAGWPGKMKRCGSTGKRRRQSQVVRPMQS